MTTNTNLKMKKKRRKKKKKSPWKRLFFLIAFTLLFTIVTGPFILLYGPFNNAKKIYVGSAMNTLSHQYLATAFLSQDKINEILSSSDDSTDNMPANASVVNVNKKADDSIERYDFEGKRFKGYMLVINDPHRVKVAYTGSLNKQGETTSQMAEKNDAVAAINGGAFIDQSSTVSSSGNGGTPTGLIMSDGKIIFSDLKSNSTKSVCMAITEDGTLLAGEYSINDLKNKHTVEALSFGPVLVSGGKAIPLSGKNASQGMAPRTAIGQRADGSIVMVVTDGRSILDGMGATMNELQKIMLNEGKCVTAINLDGGKSATMYLNGEIINTLSNGLGERSIVSSIIVK
ncbi:phosphodiester glycosidase family protein [Clostridium paridis]|nr:phosphodiester glycosidase family protein [Clostridium paridis]